MIDAVACHLHGYLLLSSAALTALLQPTHDVHAVAGSCLSGSGAYWRIALIRLAGIVLGVILAQVASIIIYSETHTDAAIARLQKSLHSTAELGEAAWLAWHLTDKPHVPAFLTAPAEELKAALDQAARAQPVSPPRLHTGGSNPMPSWHGEGTAAGAVGAASPVGSTTPKVNSIAEIPTKEPSLLVPEMSPQAMLRLDHGPEGGEAILGVLQV